MMRRVDMDLSSIDSEFCYQWLRGSTHAVTDKTVLTAFVGCNFLWSEYANAAMAAEHRPIAYVPFEVLVKLAHPHVEKKSWTHDVAPKYWRDPVMRRPDMIFTGLRYLKDGVQLFGL